jgi:hypothetical protein
MFTGFASENTPAIQVWDFFQPRSFSDLAGIVSLTDDCAPIQYFRTGASTNTIRVYLPSSPPEGKVIRFIVARYGSSNQGINIYSSDARDGTATQFASGVYYGTPGKILELVYCKNAISTGAGGNAETGWLSLTESPVSSPAFRAVALSSSSATGNHAISAGANAIASGANSVCLGGQNATASGSGAVCIGNGNASGSSSAVIGGGSNTASQTNSAVMGGSGNQTSGNSAVAIGGLTNTASGVRSSVIGGATSTASGNSSIVLGGNTNAANSFNSVVAGGSAGSARSIVGNFVYPSSDAPITFSAGVQQLSTLLLGRETTNATATVLTSNSSAAATTNQVILPNNSAYTFQGTCIANVTAGGTTSGWKFEGVVKRGANAASTALVTAVTPIVIAQDAGAVTWVLAITADTTNGGIAVTVTGAAATTIRWVTKIETTEVTF